MRQFEDDDAAEVAFYHAFANCDIKAMESVWARDEVICIHPGATPLRGYDVVIRSWSNILLNTQPPRLQFDILSRTTNEDLAVHIVKESIAPADVPFASAVILATNVYVRDNHGGWLLYSHHASTTRQESEKHTLQ